MLRLVLDTCVIVSAFRSRFGASRRLMNYFDADRFIMLASPALFLEYESILKRPAQLRVNQYSEADISTALELLAGFIEPVKTYYQWRPQMMDANDEFVLEAAVNGSADAIVTHNVRDFAPASKRFGLDVLTPGRIIKERFER